MRHRILMLILVGAGLAAVSGPRPARADLTTPPQVLSIPLTQTNFGPTTSSLASVNPFLVDKFDPTKYVQNGIQGNLIGVDLRLDYEFDNYLSARFDNVAEITVKASGSMDLTLPDGTTKLVTSPTFENKATGVSKPSDVFSKFVDFQPFPYVKKDYVAASYSDPAMLARFLYNGSGSTTINLPVFAQAVSEFSTSSGNGFGSSTTLAWAQITVVYHYLVPEPSSLVLTGLGVTGLGALVWRRNGFGLKKARPA